jgi:hypothetical protein
MKERRIEAQTNQNPNFLNPFLRGEVEKSNKTQASLSLRDQEGTKSKSLPWKEEVLERIGGERRGIGRER